MAIPPIPPSLPGLPKVPGAVTGDFATFTSNGAAVQDSGIKLDDTLTNTSTLWSSSQIQSYVVTQLLNVPTLPNVRAATTANLAALSGTPTIDGVALVAGDYVLVKNQTIASNNGFYQVAAGAWVAQKYDTTTQAFVPAAGTTTYNGLNINGGISFVTAGTTQKNLQYQCAIPIPGAAYPGGSAVNFTAVTKLPIASTSNRFVDAAIGNNTNNNGSQAFPFASITQALVGAQFPLCITLSSNAPDSSVITWSSAQSNTIVQGITADFTGGMQTMGGVQTFASGGTRNDFRNILFSTGSNTPLVFNSGYLFRNNIENVSISTTASSWITFPTNAQNFISINNVQIVNLGLSNINLPAFTNPFDIYVSNQLYSPLIFTGTGAANTRITITNCPEYFVQVPATYLGQIVWQSTGFNVKVGSTALPGGIITTQALLTTILSWTADTTYDGNYIISGFTPIANNFGNGDVFTKVTVAGVVTSTFWLRTFAYAPATVASIDGIVYQQAIAGQNRWEISTAGTTGHQYTNVYYVDPLNGLDTNVGSYDLPWQTLQFASANAPSSSIVYLSPGEYNGATVNVAADNIAWVGMSGSTNRVQLPIINFDIIASGGNGFVLENVQTATGTNLISTSSASVFVKGAILAGSCETNANSTISLNQTSLGGFSNVTNNGSFIAVNCTSLLGIFNCNNDSSTTFNGCGINARIIGTNADLSMTNCKTQISIGGQPNINWSNSTGTHLVTLSNTFLNNPSFVDGTGRITFTVTGGTLNYSLDDVKFNRAASNFSSAVQLTSPFTFDAMQLGTPLPITSGGTGVNALTANGALVSNSTGTAVATVAPGTTGNVLTSDGTSWTSQPGGGLAAQYAAYQSNTDQTGVATGSQIVFSSQQKQIGTAISVNTTNGTITLQANYTYRLRGVAGAFNGTSNGAVALVQWKNLTTNTFIGSISGNIAVTNPFNNTSFNPNAAEVTITPSVTTQVALVLTSNNSNLTGTLQNTFIPSWCEVNTISGLLPADTYLAQYAAYQSNTDQPGLAFGGKIVFDTQQKQIGTAISVNTSSGVITLQPGFTYRIRGAMGTIASSGGPSYAECIWKNIGTNANLGNRQSNLAPTISSTNDASAGTTAETTITPTVVTQVALVCTGIAGSTGVIKNTYQASWCEVTAISGLLPFDTSSPTSGATIKTIVDTNTTQVSYSGTSSPTTYSTGISATISPTYATSKVLIEAFVQTQIICANGVISGRYVIYRNGSPVYTGGLNELLAYSGALATKFPVVFLDSPATTGACVYTISFIADNSIYNPLAFQAGGSASVTTLTEIAA